MTQTNLTRPQGLNRIDPALRDAAIEHGTFEFRPETLPAEREQADRLAAERAAAVDTSGVTVETRSITGPGGHQLNLRFYRGPDLDQAKSASPLVLYAHGGGFVTGNLDTDHRQCIELAHRGRCTVVSVDYRLSPEHPYPAPLDDASAVLRWVAGTAVELGVDSARLAVAGSSAGGALAARLAQGAADGSLPPVVFQLLHQPVLDDRASASKKEFATSPSFDAEAAELMWGYYLGPQTASAAAVPARRDGFAGLPTALITCAEIDPFRDEAVQYALSLLHAGVSAELHVFPRACHGFDSLLPDWPPSQRLFAMQGHALRRIWDGA